MSIPPLHPADQEGGQQHLFRHRTRQTPRLYHRVAPGEQQLLLLLLENPAACSSFIQLITHSLQWPVQDEEEQEATHKTASKLLRHFLSKYPGELTKKLPVILPAVLSSWLHLPKWGPFRKLLS